MAKRNDSSVSRQVLTLQFAVVLVLVVVAGVLATYDARRDARQDAGRRALQIARAVADSPTTAAAFADADPTPKLQPYAEQVRRDTGVDFVVVMRLDRTRLTHPQRSKIGGRFLGGLGSAPRGGTFVQQYTGTLGPSMRALVPVRATDDPDRVIALVAVGITIRAIDAEIRDSLPPILLAAGSVLAVGLLGSWLIARRLRRQTHGMGEREITRMYEYYRAVLHAVREGLVLLDARGVVQLVNDEAVRLLSLPDDVIGRGFDGLGLPPGLVTAALGGSAESDDIYLVDEHVLVVSSAPAAWGGREVGVVVTLRDHTELQAATGELDAANRMTEALRAQNHEAANRMHTVVSLIETGRAEEAVEFATEELQYAQLLTDQVVGNVGDPALAAFLLAKNAQAYEQGILVEIQGELGETGVPTRDLVTLIGNLLDNSVEAIVADRQSDQAWVRLILRHDAAGVSITVEDNGPGLAVAEVQAAFRRGWTTKADSAHGEHGVGLALVHQVAARYGGSVAMERPEAGGARFVVRLPGVS